MANFFGSLERPRLIFLSLTMRVFGALPYLVAMGIAFVFYSDILPYFRPYAWVDDWIYTKPIAFTTFGEWWVWLWQQHVDHRIPIQKLISFFVLSLSGFDYRWIVAINFSMALAASFFLVEAAKRYRGTRMIGDIAIPFILLNFGMGFTQWAFHFQFMSSILCMSGFLLSMVIWLQSHENKHAYLAALSLTLASMTGMNGVLPVLGIGLAAMVWMIWRAKSARALLSFAVPVAIALLMLSTWTAYSAGDDSELKIGEFLEYSLGLTTASFTLFLQNNETAARIVIGVLFLAAAVALVFKIAKKRFDDVDLLVAAFLGVYLGLIASISYGRVLIQGGWNYGSAIHYGVLASFVPIVLWFIVSRAAPRWIAEVFGVAFLIVAVLVFQENYNWRAWMVEHGKPIQSKVLQDLKSDKPIYDIAADNITEFHAGMAGINEVTDGILLLREAGVEMYGGKP